jgi:hypothetical protein
VGYFILGERIGKGFCNSGKISRTRKDAFKAGCKYRVKIAQVHRLKSEQLSDVKIPFPSIYAS